MFKGKIVEIYDYFLLSLDAFMKNLDGFIPSIQLLRFMSDKVEFLCIEEKVLIVNESLKVLFENFHGFKFVILFQGTHVVNNL